MNRAEALRQIAEAHEAWSRRYGDQIPYNVSHAEPHDGEATDMAIWQADRSAPPAIDDSLNARIKSILADVSSG